MERTTLFRLDGNEGKLHVGDQGLDARDVGWLLLCGSCGILVACLDENKSKPRSSSIVGGSVKTFCSSVHSVCLPFAYRGAAPPSLAPVWHAIPNNWHVTGCYWRVRTWSQT